MSDDHFESEFEFPLWILIKKHAQEKDISYRAAALEIMPEYIKTIRYGDLEFENKTIQEFVESGKIANEKWQKLINS